MVVTVYQADDSDVRILGVGHTFHHTDLVDDTLGSSRTLRMAVQSVTSTVCFTYTLATVSYDRLRLRP